jgi:hypothetical protein
LEECNYPLAKSGYRLHILARSGVKGGPSALRRDKPQILIVDCSLPAFPQWDFRL